MSKHQMSKRIITPTIWILSLVSLFGDISSELLYPVIPVFLQNIGVSFIVIGIIEGVADFTAGISKGYFGEMSDRLRRRAVFVKAGYGVSTLAKALMAIAATPLSIFISRIFDRLGRGIRTAPRDAILADESLPQHRAAVFGFHRGMDTVGAAIGPAIALIWLHFYPGEYVQLFVFAVAPSVISFLITLLLRDKTSLVKASLPIEQRSGVKLFSFLSFWKKSSPDYRNLVLPLLLFALVNSSDVFLLLWLKKNGLSDTAVIGIYIYYNLVYAFASFPVGKIADSIGRKKVMMAGIFFFILVYALLPFAEGIVQYGVLFTVYSLYASCFESSVKAMIASSCGKHERGTAYGFYTGMISFCALAASVWTGMVWADFSPESAFIISASIAMVSLISIIRNRLFSSPDNS